MEEFSIPYKPGIHEVKISKLFENKLTDSKIKKEQPPPKVVFICFMNRSGSNLLSEALNNHSDFYSEGEVFNYPEVIKRSEKRYESFDGYIASLLFNTKNLSNKLVLKTSWAQLFFLSKTGLLSKWFSSAKYILITRKDIVSLAVSYSVAKQNKQWTSLHNKIIHDNSIRYDFKDISEIMKAAYDSEEKFKTFFKTFNIRYLEVLYEDLISCFSNTMNEVLKFLGAEYQEIKFSDLKLKKQQSELKNNFKKRFLEESSF